MFAIVPMVDEHIKPCYELEQRIFRQESPWSLNAFYLAHVDRFSHYYVSLYEGKIVGYAGICVPPQIGAEAEIHTIAVAEKFQRKGIGRSLLRTLLIHADKMYADTFLEVRVDNFSALELYKLYDFSIVGIRPKYYQPINKDAYTMKRNAVIPA